jgi:hypothetical protein
MPGLLSFPCKSSYVSSKVADSVSRVGEHSAIGMNHVTSDGSQSRHLWQFTVIFPISMEVPA